MKSSVLIILLWIFPYYLFSQDSSAQGFLDDLSNAKNIQDTIAALIAFKMNPPEDKTLCKQTLKQGFLRQHKNWCDAEIFLLEKNIDKARVLFDLVFHSNTNTTLKYYVKNQNYIINYMEDDTINMMSYLHLIDTSDNQDYTLYSANKILEYSSKRYVDSMYHHLVRLSEKVPVTPYPRLYLACITTTSNKLFNRIPEDGTDLLQEGIDLSKSIPEYKYRASLYNQLGASYKSRGDYKNAIQMSHNAIAMSADSRDSTNLAIYYYNLATYHQELGDFEKAYEIIDKGHEVGLARNDTTDITLYYTAKAFAKMTNKEYTGALALLKKSLDYETKLDLYTKTLIHLNIIDCYYTTNKLDSVYHYFNKLKEVDPRNQSGLIEYSKVFVSQYYIEKGEFKIAQKYINDADADIQAYGSENDKSIVLLAKSKLWEAQGNFRKALEAHKMHMEIEMDFRNEENATEVTAARLNAEFDKEKEIIALRNEQEQTLLQAKQTRTMILGSSALFGLLLLLIFYLLLRKKNQSLASLNNIKDTLFQIIGHDLKKPSINFRNISNNINYLLDKKDYKRLQALGNEMDHDAKSLYNLTDNLLSWALLQKQGFAIRMEKTNLRELVQNNTELFKSIASRKRINLINEVESEATSFVDKNSMDTIIRNLIDNAIKYTDEQGTISIKSKKVAETIYITVTDSGIGINKDMLLDIKKSYVSKSTEGTAGEKGSGLGLQLVDKLLSKIGGKMEIVSKPGKGSSFIIALARAN